MLDFAGPAFLLLAIVVLIAIAWSFLEDVWRWLRDIYDNGELSGLVMAILAMAGVAVGIWYYWYYM